MRTLELEMPIFVDADDKYLLLALASRLYEDGKLSLGQAARMAHVSKRAFMETMGDYGASVYHHAEFELEEDLKNA